MGAVHELLDGGPREPDRAAGDEHADERRRDDLDLAMAVRMPLVGRRGGEPERDQALPIRAGRPRLKIVQATVADFLRQLAETGRFVAA